MKKISTDRIVSLSAIFISLLTLVIFIYQTNLMQKQNRLSILPYLSLGSYINHDAGTLELELKNLGIGPAIIESRKVYYKDKWLDIDFIDLINEEYIKDDSTISVYYTSINHGTAIPANESLSLVKVFMPKEKFPEFLAWFEHIQEYETDYEIIYKSLYQDRWKINAKSNIPIELK